MRPGNQRVKPYPEIYNLWEIRDNNKTKKVVISSIVYEISAISARATIRIPTPTFSSAFP